MARNNPLKNTGTLLCLVLALFFGRTAFAQSIKITGASTVSGPLLDAAQILKEKDKSNRNDKAIDLEIHTEGGSSSWGISALGLNDVDVAMSSRFVTPEERAEFPNTNFTEIYIGEEATALVVSKDVWEGGMRAISKAQAKAIYQGKTTNWKDIGGPDLPIVGYTPEQGRSALSCYIQWIYDDQSKARHNRFATVATDENAKACLEATPGSISQVSMVYADENKLYKLAITADDGTAIAPTIASVAAHKYPMSRPLFLVTNGRPLGDIKTLVTFMLSSKGQELVHNHNGITLKELGVTPQTFE